MKTDLTALREAYAKATPGELTVEQHCLAGGDRPVDTVKIRPMQRTALGSFQRDDGEWLQMVHNAFPAMADEIEALRADVVRLREALSDLVSWFPDKPRPSEWAMKAGKYGADDAIEAARAALKGPTDDQ